MTTTKIKVPDLIILFDWFIIYSYIGWVYETIYCSFDLGRYVDRGFLYGPICPIYGVCIVPAILLFTDRFKYRFTLFLSCAFLASAVEYGTSLWMEHIFGRRWWNYSNRMLNINGRICLGAAMVFGLSGVIIIRYLHPKLVQYMNENFSVGTIKKASRALFVIFLFDVLVTFQMNL
jgi:uncharacterized membrane protein